MRAKHLDGAQPLEILIVDDNPGDIRLTQVAMKRLKITNRLHVAYNGIEALDFLHQRGEYSNAPRPHMILLDLNMPQMSRRELLQEIKSAPNLRAIPVVVLTSSNQEDDVLKSYNLHANCYITKPVELEGLNNIVNAIDNFWFTLVELPEFKNANPSKE